MELVLDENGEAMPKVKTYRRKVFLQTSRIAIRVRRAIRAIRRQYKTMVAQRGLTGVSLALGVAVCWLIWAYLSDHDTGTAMVQAAVAGIVTYAIQGLRFGLTGISASFPTIAFISLAIWFPEAKRSENFYSTTAQVIPALLIAFVLEERELRRKSHVLIRMLAGQLAICLLIGEIAALLGLSEGPTSQSDSYLPFIAGALVAGFLAIVLAAFIPEQPEPRTALTVDQLGRADYTTIGQAIRAAEPGTTIKVQPGIYREGLVVNKRNLSIVGDGDRDEIIVEAKGRDGLLFNAAYGKVTGLTIRQAGRKPWSLRAWFGVDILSGLFVLHNCDISSHLLACVSVREGATAHISQCRIHDGVGGGVFVYEDGLGTLEDNEILNNGYSGVLIQESGNPTVRKNRIHNNKHHGIFVYENGLGTLEDNDIFSNAASGVRIQEDSNPTLHKNRIHGNKTGVLVLDHGLGTLEDNKIFENDFGVVIHWGGSPTLYKNQIYSNKAGGVFVFIDGSGTLKENRISHNGQAGIIIQKGGDLTMHENHVYDNDKSNLITDV